jgi:hypothetical protein
MWCGQLISVTHTQTEKISSWNGPIVHVCCFMLARASTKTFVSRIHKTAKKIFVSRGITVHVDQITQHGVQEDSNTDMEFHCLRHVCVNKSWLYTTITCFQLATYYHAQKIRQMTLSEHYEVTAFFLSCMLFFPLILFFLKIQIIFSENKNHESPQHTVFSSPILYPP